MAVATVRSQRVPETILIEIAGNPAPPPPAFDTCLQDESNGNILNFSSTTGDYLFIRCTDRFALTGIGTVTIRGSTITLQHTAPDRRVTASIDGSSQRGTASAQALLLGLTLTISDRNTSNNGCACP